MKRNLTLSVALLTALFTLLAAGTVWKLSDRQTHTQESDNQMIERVKQRNTLLEALSTTEVCSPWMTTTIGTAGTATSTFDECAPDTLGITTNAAMSANATADNQRVIYQTLCGNGAISVKLDAITASSGFAGLFVRESLSAGSRKVALMSQKGASVFRQLRATNNQFQTQATFAAPSHNYLKLIRTGNNVVGQWSTNGTTWNTAFNTPLAVANGCVEIGLFTYSSNTGTTVTGNFSNLQYTPPAVESAVVNFTDSVLTVVPGDSVEICLNLSSECNCETVDVEIDIIGSGSPHFANFSVQTLSLTMADSMDCFKIPVDSNLASGIYMFKISNLNGHSTPVSGTDSILIVNVEGQESSTTLNCGAWESVAVIDSTQSYLFQDRFGGQYSLADIKVPTTASSFSTSTECNCDEFDETEVPYITGSYFNLSFADCLEGTGVGFDHPTYGREYRRAACRAFAYVAHRISAQTNLCGSGGNEGVNIRVELSNGPVAESLSNGTYAAASPFYEYAYLEGINNGMVWKKIIGGADDILFVDDPVFHGSLVLNVDPGANNTPNPNFSYYTGDAAPGPGDYDLYTIILHEATHLLGFASLLGVNGFHILNLPCHNHFDTHLRLNAPSGTIPVVQRSPTNPFDWGWNTGIGIGGLYNSCNGVGPDLIFEAGGSNNIIIFTGSSHQDGSSFSHIATACEGPSLMGPNIEDNTRFEYSGDELLILCSLGYEIDNDASCSCAPVAVNDDTPHCEETFWHIDLCEGESIEFTLEDIIGDDLRADVLNYIEVVPLMGNIINPGGELEGPVDGVYTYTTCEPGINFIRYEAAASDCTAPGSMGVIGIRVLPCLNCEESQQAGYNQNPCNLICNPEIVADFPAGGLISHIGCFCEADTYIPNWGTATQSADAFLVPSVFGSLSGLPDNGSLFMIAGIGELFDYPEIQEGAYTSLPSLSPGCYFYSYFYRDGGRVQDTINNSCVLRSFWVDKSISDQFYGCGLPQLSDIDWSVGGFTELYGVEITPNLEEFTRTGAMFELTEGLPSGALLIYPDAEIPGGSISMNAGEGYGIYVDQFELLPDNFSAGENISAFCGDPIVLGGEDFCMLSDVAIRYIWKDEADEVLLNYTVRRGFDGQLFIQDDLGSPLSQVPALEFTALNSATYTLERSVASGSPFSIDLCTTSDEVTVTVTPRLPQANFTFSGGDCEEDGSFTFTAGAVLPEATYSWDFGDGTTATGQVVEHTFPSILAYTVELTVSNECGESVFTQQVLAPDCLTCEDCNVNQTIGQPGVTTKLSDAIASNLLPANFASGLTRCIEGTLLLDFIANAQTAYSFYNCVLQMGPGARILIDQDFSVEINQSILLGCDAMWRGIEISAGATVKGIVNSQISDAQYGLYLNPGTAEDLTYVYTYGNVFRDNFVGVYVPGGSGNALNWINKNNKYTSTATLLPPFSGQTATPENLPQLTGGQALAGIVADDFPGVHSSNNTYQNLTSGIVLRKSSARSFDDDFFNIRDNGNHYTAFDPAGVAVYSRGSGAQTLEVELPLVDNCKYGINADMTKITAIRGHYTNVDHGIWAVSGGVGGIIIGGSPANKNTIDALFTGVLASNTLFNGIVNVSDNDITTNTPTGDLWGFGIGILFNGVGQVTVYKNEVTVDGFGVGVLLGGSKRVEVVYNPIMLTSASARAGISLDGTTSSRIVDNEITGPGTSGNTTVGLSLFNAAGNAYCCNTLEEVNVGMQVKGGCLSTDLVRGNTFGASGISLFLPVNDEDAPPYPPSIIGSQNHTKNQWLSGSGAAKYEAEPLFAQDFPFFVDNSAPNGSAAYKPSSYSPPTWFAITEDGDGITSCSVQECLTLPFAPDSDDVKKLAAGDTLLATATYWDLQRYLYKNLQEYVVLDTTILAFLAQSDTSSVGAFYAVDEAIVDLLYQDSAHQTSLATTLQVMESYLDSLVAADQLLPLSDSAQLAAWIVATNDWMNSLVVQSAYADSLASYLDGNLASGAVSIIALNDSIDAKTDFAYYEKTVNDLYLHRISGGALTSLDSSTIAILQDIAQQCPSVGGNAVLRARAWLAMAVSPAVVYFDSLGCAASSARAALPQNEYRPLPVARQADQTYRLMPNPAQHEVTIAWTIPAEAVAPFELWDTYGRVVMEGVLPTGTTNHRINTNRLAPGIYFLRIKQVGADVATIKLLIQH